MIELALFTYFGGLMSILYSVHKAKLKRGDLIFGFPATCVYIFFWPVVVSYSLVEALALFADRVWSS